MAGAIRPPLGKNDASVRGRNRQSPRVLYVTHSKNETSKRPIPLNQAAREALERMVKRAEDFGHTDPNHYLWCANQHHKFEPTKPARKWDTAWRALREAAGLPGFRFHDLRDLRHTVVTDSVGGWRARARH